MPQTTVPITKKMTDLVKLLNPSGKLVSFQHNSIEVAIKAGGHRVISREQAEHGIEKTRVPMQAANDDTNNKQFLSPLKIEELPENMRTQESLGKSAEECKRLSGDIDSLKKLLEEKDESIKALLLENSKLKQTIDENVPAGRERSTKKSGK